jgi:hypothetical protein
VFSQKTPLNLHRSLPNLANRNELNSVKVAGNQPRPSQLSPNPGAAPSQILPAHVSEVRAITTRTSDLSSKVVVTFSRDPNDAAYVNARIFVSGYKGNPSPVQIASGESPVSFSLDNTGEPVTATVQASGNLGQAPLSTAPTTTLQLSKTPLATTPTEAGDGTATTITPVDLETNGVSNTEQRTLDFRNSESVQWFADPSGKERASVIYNRGPRVEPANWRLWSSSGSNSSSFAAEAVGCIPGSQANTYTPVPPTASQPAAIQLNCATSPGGSQVIFGDNRSSSEPLNYTLGILRVVQVKAALSSLTDSRLWIAGNDHANSAESVLAGDNPGANLVGFRLSSPAGDTNFQAYAGTDATHFTVVDTGVAGDTDFHLFEIAYESGTVTFSIDGVVVATISTNLPSTSTAVGTTVSCDNVGTTDALNVQLCYSYLETGA